MKIGRPAVGRLCYNSSQAPAVLTAVPLTWEFSAPLLSVGTYMYM